ncbi:MAG: hypothetical protein F7B59_01995 [Desulfurococcales archaeon]|nr:hypothetical protein [Desulfurococcales archaeon]
MAVEVSETLKRVVEKYEDVLSSIPTEGLKNIMTRSAYSRVIDILSRANIIYGKTLCLSKSVDNCVKGKEEEYCTTECGNTGFIARENLFAIYKYGSNSFALSINEDGVTVKEKGGSLSVSGDQHLKFDLPSSEGSELIDIDTSNPEEVYENLALIKYVFRNVEALLSRIVDILNYCAKTRAVSC